MKTLDFLKNNIFVIILGLFGVFFLFSFGYGFFEDLLDKNFPAWMFHTGQWQYESKTNYAIFNGPILAVIAGAVATGFYYAKCDRRKAIVYLSIPLAIYALLLLYYLFG